MQPVTVGAEATILPSTIRAWIDEAPHVQSTWRFFAPVAPGVNASTLASASASRSRRKRNRRRDPILEFNGPKGLLDTAQEAFFLRGCRAKAGDATSNLERRHQLRPGQRAGADVQRHLGAQIALPARPRKGREPDRLPEDL